MKTIEDLKKMIKEPASKEWFKKHGTPKSKALKKKKEYALGGREEEHMQNERYKYKPYK